MSPQLTSGQQGQVLPASEIFRWDREITRAAQSQQVAAWTIAYYGFKMKLAGAWGEFQCASEDEYREKKGVARSTWYLYIGIVQNLPDINLEDLQKIPLTNAQILAQVEPELRHQHPWIEEAQRLEPAQLAERFTERTKAAGGRPREPMTFVRFKVPFSAKPAIETMVQDFKERHELSSPGQAIEFIVADRYDRTNILAKLEQARKHIAELGAWLMDRNVRDETTVKHLSEAERLLNEASQEAIESAREAGRNKNGRQRPNGHNTECDRETSVQEFIVSAVEEAGR